MEKLILSDKGLIQKARSTSNSLFSIVSAESISKEEAETLFGKDRMVSESITFRKKMPEKILHDLLSYYRFIFDKYQTEARVILCLNDADEYEIIAPYYSVVSPAAATGSNAIDHVCNACNIGYPGFIASCLYCDGSSGTRSVRVIGTSHSHANFGAGFSQDDNIDELRMPGVHLVIGNVKNVAPSYAARVVFEVPGEANRSKNVKLEDIFDYSSNDSQNEIWNKTISLRDKFNSGGLKININDETIFTNVTKEFADKFKALVPSAVLVGSIPTTSKRGSISHVNTTHPFDYLEDGDDIFLREIRPTSISTSSPDKKLSIVEHFSGMDDKDDIYICLYAKKDKYLNVSYETYADMICIDTNMIDIDRMTNMQVVRSINAHIPFIIKRLNDVVGGENSTRKIVGPPDSLYSYMISGSKIPKHVRSSIKNMYDVLVENKNNIHQIHDAILFAIAVLGHIDILIDNCEEELIDQFTCAEDLVVAINMAEVLVSQ